MLVTSISTILLFGVAVFGKTINVDVGKGGLIITPDTITAAVGDHVQFAFYPTGHTVTSSDFNTPCSPNGLVNSGFINGGPDPVFVVLINDTNPIWLYCALGNHCQSGMLAVINPPSGGNTLTAYKANANSATSGDDPAGVAGGSLVSPGSSDNSTDIVAFTGPSPQKLRAVRLAHFVLMVGSILVILPLGALSLRVLNFPGLVAFHATTQLVALTFVFAGFGLGLYYRIKTFQAYSSQPHFILGTTIVGMLVLQPIFGFIHHSLYKKLQKRTFASYLHIWWGRIIFILALTNGVLGLKLTDSDIGNQKPGFIVYSIIVGIIGTIYIAVTVGVQFKRKE
ncbi:MAG: hypothetical protein M1839_002429 [Geoglossum umbratile]|nr:MAG: hypothetical protein M1839_002429 [Geoglossum umbratile]